MLKAICPIFFVATIAACATPAPMPEKRVASPVEFRAEASHVMGRAGSPHFPPSNSRIRLNPSPEKASPLNTRRQLEVLESDPESGAFVAPIAKTPITQYFEILGAADCDKWVYIYLRTPALLKTSPTFDDYYLNPDYPEDKPVSKCIQAFHAKFKANDDPALDGADGVLVDHKTAQFTGVDGFFVQNKKIFMQGWAIRFVDPTDDLIRDRLRRPPVTEIDRLQTRAAIYWTVKNGVAAKFADELRLQLPLQTDSAIRGGWSEVSREALSAVAQNTDLDVHRKIMTAGFDRALFGSPAAPRTVVSYVGTGDAPYVAARQIACTRNASDISLLKRVVMESTSMQHVIAAARGLVAAGEVQFLKDATTQFPSKLGSAHIKIADIAYKKNDPFAFECRTNA